MILAVSVGRFRFNVPFPRAKGPIHTSLGRWPAIGPGNWQKMQ